MTNVIRQVRAYEGEVVEIAWHLNDGSIFHQRIAVPPKATRDTRTTAGQIIDRAETTESGQKF